jgi:hypothetical protein
MILIIKRRLNDECFIAKMSSQGNPLGDKEHIHLLEIIDKSALDIIIYRNRLYKLIIDKLIHKKMWDRDRTYQEGDVPNTMHDWITRCFQHNKINKFFIEVDDNVFRPEFFKIKV